MQPIHAVSDMQMADDFWGERAANAYGWRTQLEHGAVLAFGSDAPVESPNPFWGLHAAVTRQRADGTPKGGWYPEQRLSRREALLAYTQGPAFIAGMEDRLGKLAPGYLADLLALAADPFEVDPAALREMRPQKVMVGGEWVLPCCVSGGNPKKRKTQARSISTICKFSTSMRPRPISAARTT